MSTGKLREGDEHTNAGSQPLRLTVREHIARVQLDRPPVNALSQALVAELTSVALNFQSQEDVWVVVLTASGKTFCAGADLKERGALPRSHVAEVVRNIQRMVVAWIDIPQPVIAGLQGSALGGGLELALAADIIAGSDEIRLGLPEVTLGIIPAGAGTQRLAQRASLGTAGKWILSGARFTASEALQDGVIDYVFPRSLFERNLEQVVLQVASCAPLALLEAKRALNARYRAALQGGLEDEMRCYESLIVTEDRSEALRAFAEKRKPVWQKK